MIIAVDFDDTLRFSNGTANTALITWLRNMQRRGAIVILWTCREGETLREAVKWLHGQGLCPNLVNQNAPQSIAVLGRDSRKILADVYIDDKNWKG